MAFAAARAALMKAARAALSSRPVATGQALAGLAQRSMRLQCLVQDGAIWLSDDDARVEVALRWLKPPA